MDELIAKASAIKGMMEPEELAWLYQAARRMESIVELGSYKGKSTYVLCAGCPGQVYSIDCHWCGQCGPFQDSEQYTYPEFMANVGHFSNLTAIEGPFAEVAASERVPAEVDMVFIDGDHAYTSVLDDLKTWVPRTRKLVCGHDWATGTPGIEQALKEFCGMQGVFHGPGLIWYMDIGG